VADVLFGDVNPGGELPVSYSVFKFANLQLSKTSMGIGETTEVSVDVTNTSSVAGDAVAQLYIHQRYGSASRPVRQLKGFERISLQPGETKTLKFPLGKDELKYWNPQTKQWIVEPSEFDLWAGEDSTASLHADLKVTQ
jgi:beta-glucosidase